MSRQTESIHQMLIPIGENRQGMSLQNFRTLEGKSRLLKFQRGKKKKEATYKWFGMALDFSAVAETRKHCLKISGQKCPCPNGGTKAAGLPDLQELVAVVQIGISEVTCINQSLEGSPHMFFSVWNSWTSSYPRVRMWEGFAIVIKTDVSRWKKNSGSFFFSRSYLIWEVSYTNHPCLWL